MRLSWIGFFIFIGGCVSQFSAPRSISGFGSKRMLNSFLQIDKQIKITEYNDDLSFRSQTTIPRSHDSPWANAKSCDQYYLVMSIPNLDKGETTLFIYTLLDNETVSDANQITIQFIVTQQLPLDIAVAPSGRNFVFLNGTSLIVFEIEPYALNWTIIDEVPISKYPPNQGLAMSDSKISFIFNNTNQFIYNYKTTTILVRDLPTRDSKLQSIDTYNNYWLYTSSKDVILEYPNGYLHIFNYSHRSYVESAHILPTQLSATQEYIDIAVVYSSSTIVVFGTLNTNTHSFEQYNTLPSKSLGLLDEGGVREPQHSFFGISHSLLIFQVPDPSSTPTVAIAVPSLPGNHSCSMDFNLRTGVYWCSGLHGGPTNQCPSGTYQPSTGFTTCLLCPEGTYQPNEGSIECMPCKENEYCPLGTSFPSNISQNYTSQITWDFPITESATPSFEEILLMLLFASSITNTSISIVLLGCIVITSALLISLLVKHSCGVNLHQWLAKIDIHKKTKQRTTTIAKPNGTFKTETVKVESVFGGYLTLLAVFILSVGLITTIIYVNDYHPLLVGQDDASPSQNSIRTSSLQDYNTQSKASELANIIKDNLQLDITFTVYNFQTFDGELIKSLSVKNCYDQYGNDCTSSYQFSTDQDNRTATYYVQLRGSIQFSEAQVTLTLGQAVSFTWATVKITSFFGETNEISAAFNENNSTSSGRLQLSKARYLLLPSKNKVLSGLLLVPITMTVVVRETELDSDEFNRDAYMSFVSNEEQLHNMGQSAEAFALSNEPMSFQFLLELDNNWRLESEQRRFSGVGAFFAALLAILGLYEVTLLASELAHRVFHSIEKRRKKRSKYEALEDPPLIVNEKSE